MDQALNKKMMKPLEVGDILITNSEPQTSELVVTRLLDEEHVAVAPYDEISGYLLDEYRVSKKFFSLASWNEKDGKAIRQELVAYGYFSMNNEGKLSFLHTEKTASSEAVHNIGLPTPLYPISGIE